jgi:D-alanyl-D-alanine carboxypeptidase (penicillin-binding protein 5/6)
VPVLPSDGHDIVGQLMRDADYIGKRTELESTQLKRAVDDDLLTGLYSRGAGKRRLLSVVMGTASREARAAESQKLLNWGWQAWDAVRLFDAGKDVATVPVWKGTKSTARLGTTGALFVTVPKGEGEKLKTTLQRTDPLVAPLAAGQRVGTLKVSTGAGTAVAEVPLTVLEPVELAGVLGRAWDAIRLWIK